MKTTYKELGPDPDNLTSEVCQTFKELIPTLHKLFQKQKRRKHFSIHFNLV
jgi:hypothetical protein